MRFRLPDAPYLSKRSALLTVLYLLGIPDLQSLEARCNLASRGIIEAQIRSEIPILGGGSYETNLSSGAHVRSLIGLAN